MNQIIFPKLVNENRKAPQKEEDINLKNPGA